MRELKFLGELSLESVKFNTLLSEALNIHFEYLFYQYINWANETSIASIMLLVEIQEHFKNRAEKNSKSNFVWFLVHSKTYHAMLL